MSDKYILTVNTGSSSIKCALFTPENLSKTVFKATFTGIGAKDSAFVIESSDGNIVLDEKKQASTHKDAFKHLESWLQTKDVQGVGHRLVHGGEKYRDPTLISEKVFDDLEKIIPYDPLHIPSELEGVRVTKRLFPKVSQIACFDTTFHKTLSEVAKLFPIPYKYFQEGLYRYGFHGLSFESIIDTLKKKGEIPGKLIIAHLGSGCSLAAVHKGQSIDTTMGFTSTAGVVMGTRSGDIDPGLAAYLLSEKKMSVETFKKMINFESGLKGISGLTSEMSLLLKSQDKRAKLAIDVFCYHIQKAIGGFAASLGGIECLVFTGGIGENSAEIREKICHNLEHLGIKLDQKKSHVPVKVIKANEEIIIAKHTLKTLEQVVS